MAQVPLLTWIFQGIPEGIALATLTMVLGTGRFPWKKNILIGFIYNCFVYVVRLLPFTPGIHVILLAAILGLLCIGLGKLELRRGLAFSAIAIGCLVLLEFIFVVIYLKSGLLTMELILNNNLYRIFVGSHHNLVLFLLAYIIKKKNIDLNFLFMPKE